MLLRLDAVQVLSLEPLNLDVDAGECIALSGPSGSGKSRLLRAIADLDPHEGRVWLRGRVCETYPPCEWRSQVGLLPAESGWWADYVGEHFAELPDDAVLSRLGFGPDVMDWQLSRCSTGERQRLALLRLLVKRPQVLLLDEPTASLDPDNTATVETLIAEYLAREAAAAIWVSHDPQQRHRIASRHYNIVGSQLEAVA
ncbi:MAG: ATP-binding cassette domain-containing protein [Gammaproteobacteria bacterium]|nr:ATP-binding cassette domain-containing protein [Gammaproteobacteria bacterium]